MGEALIDGCGDSVQVPTKSSGASGATSNFITTATYTIEAGKRYYVSATLGDAYVYGLSKLWFIDSVANITLLNDTGPVGDGRTRTLDISISGTTVGITGNSNYGNAAWFIHATFIPLDN